jgi:hypothetical protein
MLTAPHVVALGALSTSANAMAGLGQYGSACVFLGFIEPCLPSPADRLLSGPDWVHVISTTSESGEGGLRGARTRFRDHPSAG